MPDLISKLTKNPYMREVCLTPRIKWQDIILMRWDIITPELNVNIDFVLCNDTKNGNNALTNSMHRCFTINPQSHTNRPYIKTRIEAH
jgi:hypothetical protein